MRRTASPVRVALYSGINALDVVGPVEVFDGANRWLAGNDRSPRYAVELIGPSLDPVPSESSIGVPPSHAYSDIDPSTSCATLLVPGGHGVYAAREDRRLVGWIRAAAASAERVASVCSGAFLLAEAGVLGTDRVTTHWARAKRLAAEYPELTVDAEPIYIRTGRIWTSAGVTAGIDLALAMVEDDLGAEAAQAIARHLVMFVRRPGGQSQFAPTVWAETARYEPIRTVQDHIAASPGDDLSVPALAGMAGMSERNFARVFTREVGDPPGRYVERVRVDAARRTLESADVGVAAVARQCGFGTAETMRRAFQRHIGVAPTPYRERFRRSHETKET